jgi:hypothetical protein
MNEGVQLKYGWVTGGKSGVYMQGGMYGSERADAPGSMFVNVRTDGYCEFLDDQDTAECFGFAELAYGTGAAAYSTTSGTIKGNVIIDTDAVFKIPVDTGTFTIADIGDTCDIGVTSYVQGAYLQSSTGEQIIILAGDLDNNAWVLVRLNPADMGQTNSA